MSTSPSFPRIAKNSMKSSNRTVEDNNSFPGITALKGLSLPRAPCTPALLVRGRRSGRSQRQRVGPNELAPPLIPSSDPPSPTLFPASPISFPASPISFLANPTPFSPSPTHSSLVQPRSSPVQPRSPLVQSRSLLVRPRSLQSDPVHHV